MVCELARAAERSAVCESVAKPDYSLEDHWNERDARQAIARGWDVVVLQQGPSALSESRVLLVDYTKRFDAEIRRTGARTALYMVWPSRTRRGDFPGVSQSYTAAAKAVGGLLLPAGDAWRAAWSIDPDLALYGPDGLHPTTMGTYLASLVIYRQIFNEARANRRQPSACRRLTPTCSNAQPLKPSLVSLAKVRASRAQTGYIVPFVVGPAPPVGGHPVDLSRHICGDSCRRDAEHSDLPIRG